MTLQDELPTMHACLLCTCRLGTAHAPICPPQNMPRRGMGCRHSAGAQRPLPEAGPCVQCVARSNPDTGKREVAGTHWDFDSYGGTRKRAMGMAAQVGPQHEELFPAQCAVQQVHGLPAAGVGRCHRAARPAASDWPCPCLAACHDHHDGSHAQVPDWTKDNAAGRKILEHNKVQVFEVPGFRLEGGSIHSDGQGTLIVTEQCLLHPSRNPDLGRSGIEAVRPLSCRGPACSVQHHPCRPVTGAWWLMIKAGHVMQCLLHPSRNPILGHSGIVRFTL